MCLKMWWKKIVTKARDVALRQAQHRELYAFNEEYFVKEEKIWSYFRQDVKVKKPVFLMDMEVIGDRLTELKQALQKEFGRRRAIAYSFKTNYALAESEWFKKSGLLAEVVSGWEYKKARSLGYSGNQILFNGPVKTDGELAQSLMDGAIVHLDTWQQVEQIIKLKKLWKGKKWKDLVGIRLRTEARSRFGFMLDDGEARRVIEKLNAGGVRVVGLHHHGGTDIYQPVQRKIWAKKISDWWLNLPTKMTAKFRTVDVGGGFPAHGKYPYELVPQKGDSMVIGDHIRAIREGLSGLWNDNKNLQLLVEPGRWLVEDGVVYVVRVIDVKYDGRLQEVVTNGAITQLTVTYYRPQIVRVMGERNENGEMLTKIYGATCKEDDVLYLGVLNRVKTGDTLVFYAVGAYNQSLGAEFIFPGATFDSLDPDRNYA